MSGQDGVYKALEGFRVEVASLKKQVTPVIDFLKRVQGAAQRLDQIERVLPLFESKLGIVLPAPAVAGGAPAPAKPGKASGSPVAAPPAVEVVSPLDGPPEPSALLAAAFDGAANPAAVVDAIRDVALGFFQDLGQQIAAALPKHAAPAPAPAAPELAAEPAPKAAKAPPPPPPAAPPARATSRAFVVDDLGIPPGSVVEHVQTKG